MQAVLPLLSKPFELKNMSETINPQKNYSVYTPILTKRKIISVVLISVVFNLIMVFSPLNYQFKSTFLDVNTSTLHLNLFALNDQIFFLIITVVSFFFYYPFTWSLTAIWNKFVRHKNVNINPVMFIFIILFNPIMIMWVWLPTAPGLPL